MGAAEEAIAVEFMEAWGDGTQELPDVEKILSLFTEDAVWQVWVPGGPTLRGREAIRADIERQVKFATFMECGVLHMASIGGTVFTERLDHFRTKRGTVDHHLVAVFEVTPEGLIAAWREYFDPEDVNRQLRSSG